MSVIIVNKNKYRLHPVYDLFGADKKGNLINIITKEQPESNSSGSRIKIKSNNSRSTMYDKLVFIWECYNGLKPKDKTVIHASDSESDDELDNLQLIGVDERKEIIATRWKNKPWTCSDCGFETNNNASIYHKKVCVYSTNKLTDEEYRRRNEMRNRWRNKTFECSICGGTYKNNYKYVHLAICEKNYQRMTN